jgi:hypothetical protein
VSGPVTTGTESEPDRNKRHYQRALFDGIAERYEGSRPGYPAHYDDPLGAALDVLWVTHGDTSGAWDRRLSDPEAITATGLFGTPACLTDKQRDILPASDVTALESTRAAFLSWPSDAQRHFTDELRRLLEPHPEVHLTRQTSVTMAPAAGILRS